MKPVITLKQYEDIYRILSSVGEHFSHGAGNSCQFYNVNGSFLLSTILKIEARPVMGAAFIRLNDNGDALSFAEREGNKYFSSSKGFHCWIETRDHYIDFTSPEYRESNLEIDGSTVPRSMFQKPKSTMSKDQFALLNPGDYFFSVNKELTNKLLSQVMSSPAAQDLANICCDWYRNYNKIKIDTLEVMNDLGEITSIKLRTSNLESAW